MSINIKIIEYFEDRKELKNNCVRLGFVDIYVSAGDFSHYLNHIAHFTKNGKEWFSPLNYKDRFEKYQPAFIYADATLVKTLHSQLKEKIQDFLSNPSKHLQQNAPSVKEEFVPDEEVPF